MHASRSVPRQSLPTPLHTDYVSLHTRFTALLHRAIAFAHISSTVHSPSRLTDSAVGAQREVLGEMEREVQQWEQAFRYVETAEADALGKLTRAKAAIHPTDFQRLSSLLSETQNKLISLVFQHKVPPNETQLWELFITLAQRLYRAFFQETESKLDDSDSGSHQKPGKSAGKKDVKPTQTDEMEDCKEKEQLTTLVKQLQDELNAACSEVESKTQDLAVSERCLKELREQKGLVEEHMAELKRENSLLSDALRALKDTQESLSKEEAVSQTLKEQLQLQTQEKQAAEGKLKATEQKVQELMQRHTEVGSDQRLASLNEQVRKLNARYEDVSVSLAERLEELADLRTLSETFKHQWEAAELRVQELLGTERQVRVLCAMTRVGSVQELVGAVTQLEQALKSQDEQASELLQALEAAELQAGKWVKERTCLVQQLHDTQLAHSASLSLSQCLRTSLTQKEQQLLHLSSLLSQQQTSVTSKDKLCKQLEAELRITGSLYADLESENGRMEGEYRVIKASLRGTLRTVGEEIDRKMKEIASKVKGVEGKLSTLGEVFLRKLVYINRGLRHQCDTLKAQLTVHKTVQRQGASAFVSGVQSSLRSKQQALVQRLQSLESRLSLNESFTQDSPFSTARSASPADPSPSPLRTSLPSQSWVL